MKVIKQSHYLIFLDKDNLIIGYQGNPDNPMSYRSLEHVDFYKKQYGDVEIPHILNYGSE